MNTEDRILCRIEELVELGEEVRATRRKPSPGHATSDFVDVQLANKWFTSCLNLIGRIFGTSSIHYERLQARYTGYPKWPDVDQAFGILLAAQEDFERDALFDMKQLITADLFDDFLEQAEYLLNSGYYQPAAVIAGSVLEDGLRRMCEENGIELSKRPKLDWMNTELARKSAYNKLTQKRITALVPSCIN